MSEEALVKGSIFGMVVVSLRDALANQEVDQSELRPWLGEEDFELLDTGVVTPSGWYPAETFCRFGDAGLHVLAGGSLDYYRAQGAKAVEGFMGSGAYKGFLQNAENHLEKAGETLVSASRLLFNFSHWSFQGRVGDHFELEVTEAQLLPDFIPYATVGFFEAFFEQFTQGDVEICFERVVRERIVVRGKWN